MSLDIVALEHDVTTRSIATLRSTPWESLTRSDQRSVARLLAKLSIERVRLRAAQAMTYQRGVVALLKQMEKAP